MELSSKLRLNYEKTNEIFANYQLYLIRDMEINLYG